MLTTKLNTESSVKNERSYTYTAPIYLHELNRIKITEFTFVNKRDAFNILKKEIITFKPVLTSRLTHFK